MKLNFVPAWIMRTRLASPLCMAATIMGCAFVVEASFGREPTVTLEFSTFVGSTGCSYATLREATVDSDGNILAVGRGIYRPDGFPVASVHTYGPLGGGSDIIVVKLKHDGTEILWVALLDGQPVFITYIGGSEDELLNGPAMDDAGRVFVTGFTTSVDFEVTPNAHDSTYGGGRDMFLQIYSPLGQLLYSTFAGGEADDQGRFVTADARGNPIVVGRTLPRDFPTTSGAHDRKFAGSEDLFCLKFSVSWAPTSSGRLSN